MEGEDEEGPEDDTSQIEGVLNDARGRHPDPQDVLQGWQVVCC